MSHNGSPHCNSQARFELGHVVATPGALDALRRSGDNAGALILRHVTGDWGDVPPEDAVENEIGVQQGFRLLSAYALSDGARVWIITEADRSSTCLLLPEEY